MITDITNDIVGAFSVIGQANHSTQVALFLAVFVAVPWLLTHLRGWARPRINHAGGDIVGGDKITYHDEDDEEHEGYVYEFPRPSVTATVMLVHRPSGEFFVGHRKATSDAFPLAPCLPGGFLDARVVDEDEDEGEVVAQQGERVEQTALRETLEEAGVGLEERDLHLLCVKSDPNTDPRAHVVNVCYLAYVSDEQHAEAKAGDDLDGYDWRRLEDIPREGGYAFNHYEIVRAGADMVRMHDEMQESLQVLTEINRAVKESNDAA